MGHRAGVSRHDPPSTPVEGAINDTTYWVVPLGGKGLRPLREHPTLVYCEANPNDPDTGVNEMLRTGWKKERAGKDGPRLVGGEASSDGDVLTRNGMVLMSRSRDAQTAYEASKFDVAQKRSEAIGKHGGADPVARNASSSSLFITA